jgi:hypothetical protein
MQGSLRFRDVKVIIWDISAALLVMGHTIKLHNDTHHMSELNIEKLFWGPAQSHPESLWLR